MKEVLSQLNNFECSLFGMDIRWLICDANFLYWYFHMWWVMNPKTHTPHPPPPPTLVLIREEMPLQLEFISMSVIVFGTLNMDDGLFCTPNFILWSFNDIKSLQNIGCIEKPTSQTYIGSSLLNYLTSQKLKLLRNDEFNYLTIFLTLPFMCRPKLLVNKWDLTHGIFNILNRR